MLNINIVNPKKSVLGKSSCWILDYKYFKDTKGEYHKKRDVIYERTKYIYYNDNRALGQGAKRGFLSS